MSEQDIARKITQHLTFGANNLDRSVLLRLQSARQQALELHAKPRRILNLALNEGSSDHHGAGRQYSTTFWFSLIALLAALLVAVNWQTMNGDPVDDVDATLLAAELPVHAYLDADFEKWLEQSSRR